MNNLKLGSTGKCNFAHSSPLFQTQKEIGGTRLVQKYFILTHFTFTCQKFVKSFDHRADLNNFGNT